MKRLLIAGVFLMLMSGAVLADPPQNPGGICDAVATLPLPQPAIDALMAMLGCEGICSDGTLPPCDG